MTYISVTLANRLLLQASTRTANGGHLTLVEVREDSVDGGANPCRTGRSQTITPAVTGFFKSMRERAHFRHRRPRDDPGKCIPSLEVQPD